MGGIQSKILKLAPTAKLAKPTTMWGHSGGWRRLHSRCRYSLRAPLRVVDQSHRFGETFHRADEEHSRLDEEHSHQYEEHSRIALRKIVS